MTTFLVVGLGNPGAEYERTRHNAGRLCVDFIREHEDFGAWEYEKKADAQFVKGKKGAHELLLALPDTFMNKSGSAVAYVARTRKVRPEHIVVVYDDIDLPLGTIKLSFDRGSGGHRGVDSVIKALKTREFVRIRIGVSPENAKGVAKKPKGEEKVLKFLLGTFKKEEQADLKKIFKRAHEALMMLVTDGQARAMTEYN